MRGGGGGGAGARGGCHFLLGGQGGAAAAARIKAVEDWHVRAEVALSREHCGYALFLRLAGVPLSPPY